MEAVRKIYKVLVISLFTLLIISNINRRIEIAELEKEQTSLENRVQSLKESYYDLQDIRDEQIESIIRVTEKDNSVITEALDFYEQNKGKIRGNRSEFIIAYIKIKELKPELTTEDKMKYLTLFISNQQII